MHSKGCGKVNVSRPTEVHRVKSQIPPYTCIAHFEQMAQCQACAGSKVTWLYLPLGSSGGISRHEPDAMQIFGSLFHKMVSLSPPAWPPKDALSRHSLVSFFKIEPLCSVSVMA